MRFFFVMARFAHFVQVVKVKKKKDIKQLRTKKNDYLTSGYWLFK